MNRRRAKRPEPKSALVIRPDRPAIARCTTCERVLVSPRYAGSWTCSSCRRHTEAERA